MKTDLSTYDNSWYRPGSLVRRICWLLTSYLLFKTALPFSGLKVRVLRLFGAQIGRGVVIKPHVTIKYPWFLTIGDHSWIGERVWIDNLTPIEIGAHVCLSQEAFLLTGNHDYREPSFNLFLGKIRIEDGVWIGARAVVCPGVCCGSHSVLTVASVATGNLEPYQVYSGNPAVRQRSRLKADSGGIAR